VLPDLDWQDRATCRDGRMDADAWFELTQYGQPNLVGFEALGECLRCPVRDACHVYMAEGNPRGVIAGGGWWDHHGRFHATLAHDALTPHAAAKILGVTIFKFREMVRSGLVPIAARTTTGNQLFRLEDLKRMGQDMARVLEEVA